MLTFLVGPLAVLWIVSFIYFSGIERNVSFPQVQKLGAFAPIREPEQRADFDDIPFVALLQPPTEPLHECTCNQQAPDGDSADGSGEALDQNSRSTGSSNKSTSSQASNNEDFVMVELVSVTCFSFTTFQSARSPSGSRCKGGFPVQFSIHFNHFQMTRS